MYQLENDSMILQIDSKGAEMKSLVEKKTGKEYLWGADPAYWGRTAPILFPLVGNYKNKQTYYDGSWYTMSQHGFARDMEFDFISQTENEIWFSLVSTEETQLVYPFHFTLSVGYRLNETTVEVLWKVENTDEKPMYFSIGGHPAFHCPIRADEQQTEYRIRFDASDHLVASIVGPDGLLTDETRMLPLQDGMLQITSNLFDDDAVVIEHDQAHEVSLVTPDGDAYLTVKMEAPLFGIWSPPGKHAPFICIEPWYGRCDRANFCQKLEEREWGNRLEPNEVFETSYSITIGSRND